MAECAGPLPEPLVLGDDAPVLQVELQVEYLHGLCSGSQPPQPQPAYVWCDCRKLSLLLLQLEQRKLEKLEQSTLISYLFLLMATET